MCLWFDNLSVDDRKIELSATSACPFSVFQCAPNVVGTVHMSLKLANSLLSALELVS